jgi:capsular exopolysaccharide synthesis family protein
MSKIFEAILRLERESGKLPAGVSPEVREIFQSVSESPAPAVLAVEQEPVVPKRPERIEPPAPAPAPAERDFDLATIPGEYVNASPAARIVYHSEPESAGADRFRLLRMRLWPLWEAEKLKTLLITSAHAQDGKSTIVLNLATALAEQGQRKVLVVEGDLCRPSLSSRLGIPAKKGLAECLEEGADPFALIRRMDPLGWYLLPAGLAKGNSTELLQSPALGSMFEKLAPHFEWIIIDTPPVVPLTDTLSLRQYADAGLLVVRADRTPGTAVEAAIDRFGAKKLLGIVLNGSDEMDRVYADYRKTYGVKKNGAPAD